MNKRDIVTALAKEQFVESMVMNIAHAPMSADLADLAQMVYLILLEYDEQKIQDLHEHNQMSFFVARIILNQFHSNTSPFHCLYRKFRTHLNEALTLDERKNIEIVDIITYRNEGGR